MSPEDFAAEAGIHPDSLEDYKRWHALLVKWNQHINLVAPSTIGQFWTRHALDSAQICRFVPPASVVVDFGSGGGFPALSIAIEAKHEGTSTEVHLIESVGKKANFLKTVSRETYLHTNIHAARIESVAAIDADIITCRAFAPTKKILDYACPFLKPSGKVVLLKGENVGDELEQASRHWKFTTKVHPSLSDSNGHVVEITEISRR
ncbi:MAG: 16S rRNA (guanine(527)-N(7))-methyltransferase RsmG [Litorimonas sp.]